MCDLVPFNWLLWICLNILHLVDAVALAAIRTEIDRTSLHYVHRVQEHQQKAAAQDEPEEPEEPEGEHQQMVDIAEQLGLEVAHDEDSEEESEPPSKPASRNVSEITQAAARVIEPKVEERQLSKKVCSSITCQTSICRRVARVHLVVSTEWWVVQEKKLKEMEELQAVLGELGIDEAPAEGEVQESKKKKKKKDKAKTVSDDVAESTPEADAKMPAAPSVEQSEKVQVRCQESMGARRQVTFRVLMNEVVFLFRMHQRFLIHLK